MWVHPVLPNTRRFGHRKGRALRLSVASLPLALAVTFSPCLADIIYLKNGQKIVAQVIREDAKQVVYEQGGGEYAIPVKLVERIEKTPLPSPEAPLEEGSHRAIAARDLPLPPAPESELVGGAFSQVIKDNALDRARLGHLEDEALRNPSAEKRQRLVRAYHEAAGFLTRTGDPESAIELYRHGLKFVSDDLSLTLAMGYLLVKQTHYNEAVDLLRPEAVRNSKSPEIPLLLGSAYYSTENLERAIEEWKRSLALRDNPRLREALAQAEKERSVASSFQELRTQHFLLRYEGRGANDLATGVLSSLEGSYQELERDLDVYPRETIVVLLYPDQAFRDITRMPSWVGALNDGKIRVPVSGLSSVTLILARALKHELTHSFVRQATQGRCPVWFNEGLAQLEEGSTTASLGTQLARAFSSGQTPAYTTLEGSFLDLPEDQVGVAYAKSLAALEYLRDTYGMAEIQRLVKSTPANPDFKSLLQHELQLTYPEFEQVVGTYIEKRYGS